MVIVFIIVGLLYDWGGVKGHPGPVSAILARPVPHRDAVALTGLLDQGLSNWRDDQAFVGGFSAFAQTFVFAFYSYGGVELVTLAAGESARPHKTVPRAVRATFLRVVLFYMLTMLTIGLCINWQDPTLLNAAFGELDILQKRCGPEI